MRAALICHDTVRLTNGGCFVLGCIQKCLLDVTDCLLYLFQRQLHHCCVLQIAMQHASALSYVPCRVPHTNTPTFHRKKQKNQS